MESAEAREHLRAVDRIVAATDRTVLLPPLLLIAVGVVCAIINGVRQARGLGIEVPADQYIQLPLISLIVLVSIVVWMFLRALIGALPAIFTRLSGSKWSPWASSTPPRWCVPRCRTPLPWPPFW